MAGDFALCAISHPLAVWCPNFLCHGPFQLEFRIQVAFHLLLGDRQLDCPQLLHLHQTEIDELLQFNYSRNQPLFLVQNQLRRCKRLWFFSPHCLEEGNKILKIHVPREIIL